jgi:hypothetical protein
MGSIEARSAWVAGSRPTILFVVAFALAGTLHETTHAVASYLLGFNSTLFQLWVNPDTAAASSEQIAWIATAGPMFSLTVGAVSWLLYKRSFKQRPSGLFYLMLSLVGVYSFLGPLAGAGFGGDFNAALTSMGAARVVLYVLSATGLVLLPWFMFLMGKELLCWVPREFGRAEAIVCAAIAPWLIGTALTLLVYWPLPAALVGSTLSGSIFWVFAALGAASGFSTRPSIEAVTSFTRWDLILAIAALALVRVFASGIRLVHS